MTRVKKYANVDGELGRDISRDQPLKKQSGKGLNQSQLGANGKEKEGSPSRSSFFSVSTAFKDPFTRYCLRLKGIHSSHGRIN